MHRDEAQAPAITVRCSEDSEHLKKIPVSPKRDRNGNKGRTVYRMRNNIDELAKLRARCSELKTTLDRHLKENHGSLIRIANVNYYIDRLLESRKDTSLQSVLKTNLVAAEIHPYTIRTIYTAIILVGCLIVPRPFSLRQKIDEIIPFFR